MIHLCFFSSILPVACNFYRLLQTPGLRTSQFQADVTTTCLKELHCLVTISPFQELKVPFPSPFIIFSSKIPFFSLLLDSDSRYPILFHVLQPGILLKFKKRGWIAYSAVNAWEGTKVTLFHLCHHILFFSMGGLHSVTASHSVHC